MKLNYKIWKVLESIKNPERDYLKHVYCDKDYIVATTGYILVAIPKEQAFSDFDPNFYKKMEGNALSISVAKEIFKNNFVIEDNLIKISPKILLNLSTIKYPAWEKVVPKFPSAGIREGVTSFNLKYLRSLCEAINYDVPILVNTGSSGLLIKDHENIESSIIAMLMPCKIPSIYAYLV